MNQREKEEYLREYSLLKTEGKPFFPYAVAKDSLMACVVMACIITLSLVLGAELGSKANPTTTTYVPRPEWYFFFLFELLRVIKPPSLVGLATIGIPTLGMILLFLLPFYDRGPERRPERRPIATLSGIFRDRRDGLPHLRGRQHGLADRAGNRHAGGGASRRGQRPRAVRSRPAVVAQSGCEACHKIGEQRQRRAGPGADARSARASPQGIARTLVNPTQPMPSFKDLPPKQFEAIVDFLSQLK